MVRFSKIFVRFLEGLPMALAILFLFYACRKKEIPPDFSKANFVLTLKSGSSPLIWDSLCYTNAAGNKYSVESLQLYISEVTFKNNKGSCTSKGIFYLDPKVSSKNSFFIDSITPGEYDEVSFIIGLSNARNISNSLPNTIENLNMAWPSPMGGGYHFMKFEGRYEDTVMVRKGYAIHLGKNNYQTQIKISKSVTQKYWNHSYNLIFNVNEIFANPYTYNFNYNPNYTMSDTAANLIIINNLKDAFSLE